MEKQCRTEQEQTRNPEYLSFICICFSICFSKESIKNCVRKGTLMGTEEESCWSVQRSEPNQHNLRWEMGTGSSCMETGFGNEESQGLTWKGRIGGKCQRDPVSRAGGKGVRDATHMGTSLSTKIRMPLRNPNSAISVAANCWEPLSCLFSFQQNIQEIQAFPTALP